MSIVIVFLVALILAIVAIVYILQMYLRSKSNEDQSQKKIHDLQTSITSTKLELEKEAKLVGEMSKNNQYEVLSGEIISHMNYGVMFIDHTGTVLLTNQYAEKFLENNPAIGKSYQQVLHVQKNKQRDYSSFEEALLGKNQILSDGFELVSQQGSIPITGTITPLISSNKVKTIIFIFADNSENILRSQEEKAFFSAAAHDLRTPLTAIRMSVALILEQFDTLEREEIIKYLKITNEAIDHLVNLVNALLNVSKIDQGRLLIENKPFNMVELTDKVIQELSILARERKLYIHHLPVQGDYRNVVGDPTKSMEVLTNIISNSIKYTVQGGVTVSHIVVNNSLVTKITDTGSGIPEESKPLLFKRFFQIGSARQQPSAKGSGLGLYISKKIANLMGGDIALESSEPGVGSTFTFTLPFVEK